MLYYYPDLGSSKAESPAMKTELNPDTYWVHFLLPFFSLLI